MPRTILGIFHWFLCNTLSLSTTILNQSKRISPTRVIFQWIEQVEQSRMKTKQHRSTHQGVLLRAVATETGQQCPGDRWQRCWHSSVSQGRAARWTVGATSHRPSQPYHLGDDDNSTTQRRTLVITAAIGSIWNCNWKIHS